MVTADANEKESTSHKMPGRWFLGTGKNGLGVNQVGFTGGTEG
jgi:hypothetical protein